jgi:hypothetical protein
MKTYRTGFLLCALFLWGCASLPHSWRQPVHHVVLVWLPESATEQHLEDMIAATRRLGTIPGVSELRVGRAVPSDRGIVDDSFDVGIVMSFDGVDAMNRYLEHPRHLEFVERYVRGRVERLVVYDIRDAP